MDDEEIYDDGVSAAQNDRKSKLNLLRSRFENKDTSPPIKPNIPSKPGAEKRVGADKPIPSQKPKWGGGSSEPVSTARNTPKSVTDNKPVLKQTDKKDSPDPASNTEVSTKRMSASNNIQNLQSALQQGVLKPHLRHVSPATRNNNDSNNNSSTKPAEKPTANGTVPKDSTVLSFAERRKLMEQKCDSNIKPKPVPSKKPGVWPPVKNTADSNDVERRLRTQPGLPANFAKRKSIKRISVTREADGQRYYKLDPPTSSKDQSAPEKPAKLGEIIDFDALMSEFKLAVKKFDSSSGCKEEEIEEAIYDDGESFRPVSFIEPMDEEEELQEEQKHLENLPPPPTDLLAPQADDWPETYDDVVATGSSVKPEEEVGGEEIYEMLEENGEDEAPPIQHRAPPPVPAEAPTVPPTPPKGKDHKEGKDPKELKKEKERIVKEENEKKKLYKDLKKNFGLTEQDMQKSYPKGKVTQVTKGKSNKHDLAVQKDQIVDILQTNIKQKGKWLARVPDTLKVGYVEANNIEMMEGFVGKTPKTSTSSAPGAAINDVGGEEMYEDVGPDQAEQEAEADDIYEFVPE